MSSTPESFYGCLCLETSVQNTLPDAGARQSAGINLPEIHFNIWEEGINTEPFLDIGVMLNINDPAERIEIFLPWIVKPENIEDLSSRILGANGVTAVFNEAWTSSHSKNNPGGFISRTDGSIFTIIPYKQPIIEERVTQWGNFYSIVLDIRQLRATSDAASKTAHKNPDQMYVRIRVKCVPRSFYRVGIDQGDALGGASLYRTEIIDFRLNVRRGVPAAIEAILAGRFIEFSKVQLFLMKSRDQDIVFEDKLFKACRSLEDEKFWAEYILPSGSSPEAVANSFKHVQSSLGYQWRKTPDSGQTGVQEFGILARFKSFHVNKRTAAAFVVLALVVGAAGNGLYDLAGCAAKGLSVIGSKAYAATMQTYERAIKQDSDKEFRK